ncbi:helix-turn-helix domain-containing protein [Erythrobacter rubeus]|uniref:Helix-turn-helix domain-containing protein n=1 Tax=Erythrobacter rubeus TaxID=2760803 RepID=A0ABR8KL39_9SPHN|nr:helix-turn-helix domain-containing protein [Erythrobacter rubeus]MBD2841067.1 helix-turn-helix domain-containing protein [Erythrobacter rubeus]
MNQLASFDIFMRTAFGVEPAARAGLQLRAMAVATSLRSHEEAQLGTAESKVLYVGSGATKLAACASGNREQIIAFHFGGDIFSVPADDLHCYSVCSLEPTHLLVFPARAFFDCASGDPRIARALLERQRTALHRCRDKAVALGQKSALERLAGFLLAMAERIGTGDGSEHILDLPMSRRDIADSLGLTSETVSRQLGALRKQGLIETCGRARIVVSDLKTLAHLSGHCRKSERTTTIDSDFDLDQCEQSQARLTKPQTGGHS